MITIQITNPISATLHKTYRLCFTCQNAVNSDVQIPTNAFYMPEGVATTHYFTFMDWTSATIFTILNTSTFLLNLGLSAVQNWASAVTPECKLASPQIIEFGYKTGASGSNILKKMNEQMMVQVLNS